MLALSNDLLITKKLCLVQWIFTKPISFLNEKLLCGPLNSHIFSYAWFCSESFLVNRIYILTFFFFLSPSGLGVRNQFHSSHRTLVHWKACPNCASLNIFSTSDLLFLQKQTQLEQEGTCHAISLLQYSLVGGHDLLCLYRRFLLTSLKSAICSFPVPQKHFFRITNS